MPHDPLAVDAIATGAGETARLDVDALSRVPPGPVHLRTGGLDAASLAASGGDLGRVRAAVLGLLRLGRAVHLEIVLDEVADADAVVDTAFEVAAIHLRGAGALTVSTPLGTHADPLVQAAMDGEPWDGHEHHTASFARLRELWIDTLPTLSGDAHRVGERAVRRLDDARRRATFDLLTQAWRRRQDGWPGDPPDQARALAVAEGLLGEQAKWRKALRQYTYDTIRRMVLIPTWQCELRCSYCFIPKQDGRVMSDEVAERAVEMLLSTPQPEVVLQFFGGEALLEYARVQHAIVYAERRAEALGKRISFVISTNGWSLTPDKLDWLAQHPVRLELSLDGDQRTQERYRASRWRDQSSYEHSIATHADAILASGIPQWVIMVVHPTNVDAMPDNFFHLADMGFQRIQINNMLGRVWTPEQTQSFAEGLRRIGEGLIERWTQGQPLEFINMNHRPMAMRLNGEVTIDFDGTVFGGNAFLHETEHKDKFVVGHLDDLTNVERYWVDATDNHFLLDWSYRPKVTQNNVEVGKVMTSFIRWMNGRGYGARGLLALEQAGASHAPA